MTTLGRPPEANRTPIPRGDDPTRVAICDDRAEIRRALQAALSILSNLAIVAEAWDVSTYGHVVHAHQPDLLVLDANIPGGGANAARLVKSIRRSTIIVAYSGRHEKHVRDEMLNAGAGEFVLKTGRIGPLLETIAHHTAPHALVAGQTWEGAPTPAAAARALTNRWLV